MEWEAAKQGGKKKTGKRHGCLIAIVAIIGIALVGSLVSRCSGSESEKLEWPTSGLAAMLPTPPSDKGNVVVDSEDMFSASVDEITSDEYKSYVEACADAGFSIEAKSDSTSYEAFAESGERLSLLYFESSESLSIDVDAAVEMSKISWPTSGPASLLPEPPSTMGHVDVDNSTQYTVTLGELEIDQFKDYADACSEAGFSVDYNRGDDFYQADNDSGANVRLDWVGNGMMTITVRVSDEQETESETEPSEEENSEADSSESGSVSDPEASSSSASGVSPDFKASMDEYEQFFDQYVEFMNSYDSSSPEMLLEYGELMTQYSETMDALDAIDENSLSDADLAYFNEVMGRINQKLAGVGA